MGEPWCTACRWVEAHYSTQLSARGVYVHIDESRYRHPLARMGIAVARLPTLIVIDALTGARRIIVGAPAIRLYLETGKP